MCAPPPVVELRELAMPEWGSGVGRQLHMPGHPEDKGLEDGPRERASRMQLQRHEAWPGLPGCRRLTTRIPRDGYREVLTSSGHPAGPGLLLPRIGDDVC